MKIDVAEVQRLARPVHSLMDEIRIGVSVFQRASSDLNEWFAGAPIHLQKVPVSYSGQRSRDVILCKEWNSLQGQMEAAFAETQRIISKFGADGEDIAIAKLRGILNDRMESLGKVTVHSLDPTYRLYHESRAIGEFSHGGADGSASVSRYSYLLDRAQPIYGQLIGMRREIRDELDRIYDEIDKWISGDLTRTWEQADFRVLVTGLHEYESAALRVKASGKGADVLRRLYASSRSAYVNTLDRSFLSSYKQLRHQDVVAEARRDRDVLRALLMVKRPEVI